MLLKIKQLCCLPQLSRSFLGNAQKQNEFALVTALTLQQPVSHPAPHHQEGTPWINSTFCCTHRGTHSRQQAAGSVTSPVSTETTSSSFRTKKFHIRSSTTHLQRTGKVPEAKLGRRAELWLQHTASLVLPPISSDQTSCNLQPHINTVNTQDQHR